MDEPLDQHGGGFTNCGSPDRVMHGKLGFTAEFPFGNEPSLFRATGVEPHPRYGNRLFLIQSFRAGDLAEQEGVRLALSLLRRALKMQHRTAGAMVRDETGRQCAILEARRRLAVRILKADQPRAVVADLLGVHRCTLWRWRRASEQGGAAALTARLQPGARPKLSLSQRRRLMKLLSQDPTEHGWPTSLWTGRRVAELIRRHFAVRYHPAHVRRLLRAMGLSRQKPQPYARERDEAAVAHWRRYRWPALKKSTPGAPLDGVFR